MEAYVITTEHRGVFFGYSEDPLGKTMTLKKARNCLYWRGIKGVFDLAVTGPTESCRVGPAVSSILLCDITSVTSCSSDAIKRWELAPW